MDRFILIDTMIHLIWLAIMNEFSFMLNGFKFNQYQLICLQRNEGLNIDVIEANPSR